MGNKRVTSFSDLFDLATDSGDVLSTFILGHLMIEFLMVKLVEIKTLKSVRRNATHRMLIEDVFKLRLISSDQKEVLLAINQMRNKFAHDITFQPTIKELIDLFSGAKKCFHDLTDGLDQGLSELRSNTRVEDCEPYIFSELFIQITYDLHEIYCSLGGEMDIFRIDV